MFIIALLAALAYAVSYSLPADYDFWWHLANGRYMVTQHALPVPDPYSFTAAGRGWIAHEWLPELLMYLLYRPFGVAGPAALYGLSLGGAVFLTTSVLRRLGASPLPSAGLAVLYLLVMLPFIGPRPQVAAFALFALVAWILERWIHLRDRSVWALPAVFLLWANVHGSFVVGLALPVLVLAGDELAARLHWPLGPRLESAGRKRLAQVIASCCLAIVVNPNGPRLLLYPFTKLNNPVLKTIPEWNATDFTEPAFWSFGLLLGIAVVMLIVRRPTIHLSDLLVVGTFAAGALWGRRFIPFAAVLLVIFIGRMITRPNLSGVCAPRFWSRLARWRAGTNTGGDRAPERARLLNAVVVLAVVVFPVVLRSAYDPATDKRLPVAAVDYLEATGVKQPLLNQYNWGGYLIWRLWPGTKVFIDGRGDDLYMNDDVLRRAFGADSVSAAGEGLLDTYAIQQVLYPKTRPLVRYLLAGGGWQVVYDDGEAVILDRRN